MQSYPHHYRTTATGGPEGDVALSAAGLETLRSASPAEFDGPGDRWSPETLLVAAIADCFILTFRAVARASKLEWTSLECEAEGVLERVERTTRFTRVVVRARLGVPEGTDPERAERLLEKAEHVCLITNSMTSEVELEAEVVVGAGTEEALVG